MLQGLVTVAWVYTEERSVSLGTSFLETSAELRASAVELLTEWGHIVDKLVYLVPRSPVQHVHSDLCLLSRFGGRTKTQMGIKRQSRSRASCIDDLPCFVISYLLIVSKCVPDLETWAFRIIVVIEL